MTFIVRNKKELEESFDRGRCIICGELGGVTTRVMINKIEECVVTCSPDCENELKTILKEI